MRPDRLATILTNCPDVETADVIAEALIAARLAACANRYPQIRARYRWEGRVADDPEVPLLIKTAPGRVAECVAMIRRLHPYELPAILHREWGAEPEFLDWVIAETSPSPTTGD